MATDQQQAVSGPKPPTNQPREAPAEFEIKRVIMGGKPAMAHYIGAEMIKTVEKGAKIKTQGGKREAQSYLDGLQFALDIVNDTQVS